MRIREVKEWPHRLRFRELVDAWIEKNYPDVPVLEAKSLLAKELGTSAGTLKQYYSGTKIPGRDRLQIIGKVLGCNPGELLGDAPMLRQGGDLWSKLSEEQRAAATTILADLLPIPDPQVKSYLRIWKQGVALGAEIIAAEAKARIRKK